MSSENMTKPSDPAAAIAAGTAPQQAGQIAPEPIPNPKIQVKSLDFYYGKSHALKDINIEIPNKEVTAFFGPSGCGKSTLLRVLNRMYSLYHTHIATGTVLIDGQDILRKEVDVTRLRTRVGMVFQKPTPFPMSIYDNIAFGIRMNKKLPRSDQDAKVEQVLQEAALWDEVKDRLKHSAANLSGGQQQRLCIARSLVSDPEVLLMDEPCSALDPIATAKVEELILELRRSLAVVVVTHSLQQASRASTYSVFMYLGRVMEVGPTERLFSKPKSKLTEDYLTGRFG
jgi:phosphate transport system ATP-binding protein